MKKLTAVLIAVFLFPASFALGGEHPALASERPSLVNDDLAFAFHGDVPLKVQFLSKVEMEQTRGQAFPIILAITLALRGYPVMARGVLWAWNNRKKIRMGAVALAGMVKIGLDYLGDKEADALREKHDKEINDLKQEHQDLKERVRKLEERLLEQTDSDNISAYKSVIYNAIADKAANEYALAMQYAEVSEHDYQMGLGYVYEGAEQQANNIVEQIEKDLGLKAFTPSKSTTTSTTTPNKSTSTSTTTPGESTSTSTTTPSKTSDGRVWVPRNDGSGTGRYYSEFEYRNLVAGDRNHGGIWGGYIGGYQTGYCSGNTCTVTYHRGRFWGSRYRR